MTSLPFEKVKVEENTQADRCYYLDIRLAIEVHAEADALEFHGKLMEFLEMHGAVTVTQQKMALEAKPGDEAAVVIFEAEENEADAALRKLTQNRGNGLWIDYLEKQLKVAKGLKVVGF